MRRVPDDLVRGCRQGQLIGGGLLLALVMYAFVVEQIRAQQAPFSGFVPGAPVALLRLGFVVMSGLALVVGNLVRSNVLAGRSAATVPVPGTSTLVQRLLTASIVMLALCEAIAIYGLVLFLIGGRRADFYGFSALALLAFAVYFPRRSQWEAWARQA